MPITETFHGFIENTTDALLLFEACRKGILSKISRRLQEKERSVIQSGSIFIFDENDSGIKRWTDGRVWSPSRILGNFLIYRELDGRNMLYQDHSDSHINSISHHLSPSGNCLPPYYCTKEEYNSSRTVDNELTSEERYQEKILLGSLANSYKFRQSGLIKKTISIKVDGLIQHLVSYYSKTDVMNSRLATPSSTPNLSSLLIPPDLLLKQSFRVPPSVECADLLFKYSITTILSPPSSISATPCPGSKKRSNSHLENDILCPSKGEHHYNDSYRDKFQRIAGDKDNRVSKQKEVDRLVSEMYTYQNNRNVRNYSSENQINMPPLSIVTENIPFYSQSKSDKTDTSRNNQSNYYSSECSAYTPSFLQDSYTPLSNISSSISPISYASDKSHSHSDYPYYRNSVSKTIEYKLPNSSRLSGVSSFGINSNYRSYREYPLISPPNEDIEEKRKDNRYTLPFPSSLIYQDNKTKPQEYMQNNNTYESSYNHTYLTSLSSQPKHLSFHNSGHLNKPNKKKTLF